MFGVNLKQRDLIELSRICAPEYNMPEFSDRVLVLDVMQDGWETTSLERSSDSSELDVRRSNCTVETNIVGKRSGEITNEEPEPKRKRKVESVELHEADFESDHGENVASEHFVDQEMTETEIRSEVENESDEQSREQAKSKKVVHFSIPPLMQENLNEPLRKHKIYIHSLWLAVQSSYFRSLLHSSGMKETLCREVHLKISESEENAHLILVEAMYRSDVLNNKSVDELLAVLELADKYDVKFVFRKCKYVLQTNATTFEISTQIMHVIKVKHNMNDVEDLAATLQVVLAQEFSPLHENWQSEKFSSLSEPSVKYLLSNDDLIVQSENTVFQSLMHWMEQNDVDPASLEETNDLLAVVRFKSVTIDYLYNVIKTHPIAQEMPKFVELYLAGITYHAIPQEQKHLLFDQPMLRKKPNIGIYQHTFVIKKEDYDNVRRNTKFNVNGDEFWACGYKMSIDGSLQWSFFDRSFQPYLTVHDLNLENLVPLEFSIAKTQGDHFFKQGSLNFNSCRKEHDAIFLSPSDFENDDNTCKFFVRVKLL